MCQDSFQQTKSLVYLRVDCVHMVTPGHWLIYGDIDVGAFERRVINDYRLTSLLIKINLDLEIFKVKRFALNHEENLGKSESLL